MLLKKRIFGRGGQGVVLTAVLLFYNCILWIKKYRQSFLPFGGECR
jgi:hypothetical protein